MCVIGVLTNSLVNTCNIFIYATAYYVRIVDKKCPVQSIEPGEMLKKILDFYISKKLLITG